MGSVKRYKIHFVSILKVNNLLSFKIKVSLEVDLKRIMK